MAEYEVVGFRSYSFNDKETGNKIDGVTVFCMAEEENVTGKVTEKFSMSQKKLSDINWIPMVGDMVTPYYNKYGKVDSVKVL